MTIKCGFNVSCTAFPSLKNSGFVINPNPLPTFLLDFFSNIFFILLLVVPGTTVLLITIIGFFFNFNN